jgi:hypothetical protein
MDARVEPGYDAEDVAARKPPMRQSPRSNFAYSGLSLENT